MSRKNGIEPRRGNDKISSKFGVLTYPSIATESDVEAFFASEVEKHGADLDGVYFAFEGNNTVALTYPEGIDESVRDEFVDLFASDLLAYVEPLNLAPAAN